jgi:pyridoxal phosphate-dependent aminotransferase EpsN
MHLQPLFKGAPYFLHDPKDDVSARLFERGVCLPSGSNLTDAEIARVIDHLRRLLPQSLISHAAS